MSFRIKYQNNVANTSLIDLSVSYNLRYILSLSLFLLSINPTIGVYIIQFLAFLNDSYPYVNTKTAYKNYYITNPIDPGQIPSWINGLTQTVLRSQVGTFTELPSPSDWGPIYWKFLSSIAGDENAKIFVSTVLPYMLPCDKCKANLLAYLITNPIDVTTDLNEWLKELQISITSNQNHKIASNSTIPIPMGSSALLTLSLFSFGNIQSKAGKFKKRCNC